MQNYQTIVAGVLGAAALVGLLLYYNRGAAPRLEGEIIAVRTLGMDENSSVAIIDFDCANRSDNLLIIAKRELSVVDQKGNVHEGSTISASNLKRLFDLFSALGPMENEPVIDRIEVPPGETLLGMVAARFEIPKHELDARRQILLRVTDVDGAVSELSLESELEEVTK